MCGANGAGHVYILNRTVSKAQAIADHMNDFFGKQNMTAMSIQDYHKLPEKKIYCIPVNFKGPVSAY